MLPKGLTKIEDRLFCDCVNLHEITLPDGITYIGRGAFERSGLRNIVIPDGVTHISNFAFADCAELVDVYIPASVTGIGNETFFRSPGVVIHRQ